MGTTVREGRGSQVCVEPSLGRDAQKDPRQRTRVTLTWGQRREGAGNPKGWGNTWGRGQSSSGELVFL